jgi:hypothetical protein
MRVVHVITRLIVGGAQENTVDSVLGLRRKPGLDPRLVSGPCSPLEGSLESRFADCPELLTLLPDLVRPINRGGTGRPIAPARVLSPSTARHRPHSQRQGRHPRPPGRRSRPGSAHSAHGHGPSFGPFQDRPPIGPFGPRNGLQRGHHSFCRRGRCHARPVPAGGHRSSGAIHQNS